MDLGAAGLNEQPFRTHGKPLAIVSYASQQDALKVLEDTCEQRNGLSLLQGPALSGKSTLIRLFAKSIGDETAVAIVDGGGMNTAGLLESALRQFGYSFDHSSTSELLGMLRVFALHQAASNVSPILIIENTHALNPSGLRALCELAGVNFRGTSAFKIILVSDRSLASVIESPAMECILRRLTHDFHLRPMASGEAVEYLHAKLRAAGSDIPDFVLPRSVCFELWRASGGWPGILDRIALLALAKADTLPITSEFVEQPAVPSGTWEDLGMYGDERQALEPPEPPTLYVTHHGQTLRELKFDQPRLLIGRSEHNDIPITSKFVSRHHALMVRHGSATFLMDLNSTNGTLVNSKRVSNHLLVDNDIITIGHHRIKFSDAHATKRGSLEGTEFADTVIMKSLDDMRRLLAQENTEMLPSLTENLSTSGLK